LAELEQKPTDRQPPVPEERRRQIAQLIRDAGSVTVAELEQRFGMSPMTIRRDLELLERDGAARRTHGGAVLPGFAGNEDSFHERLDKDVDAKERLARAAVALLRPGESVFLDSSTSAYYAARTIISSSLRVTILTHSLPIMDLFSTNEAPNVELVGVGGTLRKLTLSFVGPHAVHVVASHFADKAFISIKGITNDGFLTDPDALEAEVKRTMLSHAEQPILLADGSKFAQCGLSVIGHVSEMHLVLTADGPADRCAAIAQMGVDIRNV
jgi:DeoR/GlpR family transcriptional regulator of sugar metabolism